MDPNTARETMIEKANTVLGLSSTDQELPPALLENSATELAEAVHALDEWLRFGGFLPQEWNVNAKLEQPGRKTDVDVSVPSTKPAWEDTTAQVNRTGEKCGQTVGVMEATGRAYRPCMLDRGHYGSCVPQDA